MAIVILSSKSRAKDIGIIIEVKYAENARYSAVCQGALKQIDTDSYTAELEEEGCHTIYKYGIACYKKKCRVVTSKKETYMPTE